jgi:hypothetical protein
MAVAGLIDDQCRCNVFRSLSVIFDEEDFLTLGASAVVVPSRYQSVMRDRITRTIQIGNDRRISAEAKCRTTRTEQSSVLRVRGAPASQSHQTQGMLVLTVLIVIFDGCFP